MYRKDIKKGIGKGQKYVTTGKGKGHGSKMDFRPRNRIQGRYIRDRDPGNVAPIVSPITQDMTLGFDPRAKVTFTGDQVNALLQNNKWPKPFPKDDWKKNKGKGKNSQKTCYTCGILGHISPECRPRKGKGDKEMNQQDKIDKNNNDSKSPGKPKKNGGNNSGKGKS